MQGADTSEIVNRKGLFLSCCVVVKEMNKPRKKPLGFCLLAFFQFRSLGVTCTSSLCVRKILRD